MRTLLLLLLVGCATPDSVDITVAEGPPLDDRENQGRHLLGGGAVALDDLPGVGTDHYSLSAITQRDGKPVRLSVVGARLFASDGLSVPGLTLVSSVGTSQLKIVLELSETPDDPLRYTLLYQDAGGVWLDPCNGDAAVPFSGRFTRAGEHVAATDEISFACASGTAYKCVNWDYIPSAADGSGDDMWDVHEACSHMASATYCMDADRTSFTREGTFIELMDDFGIHSPTPPNMSPPMPWSLWMLPANTWPPERGTFYIEAAWDDTEIPKCISKVRWASMPTDPCVGGLPDPRVDPTARYCEELSNEQLAALPGLVWNLSLANDLPFDTWKLGTEFVTTVRGFHDARRVEPPAPGMTLVGSSGILLREPTSKYLDAGVLDEMRLYCVPSSLTCVVTTASTIPVGYTFDRGFEGYVFKSGMPRPRDTIALHLYENPVTSDWVTALAAPSVDHVDRGIVGYVFR